MVKSITSFMEKAYCTYRKKLQTIQKTEFIQRYTEFSSEYNIT